MILSRILRKYCARRHLEMVQSMKLRAMYGKFKTNMLYKFIRINAVES
jgi:hypothetical protein